MREGIEKLLWGDAVDGRLSSLYVGPHLLASWRADHPDLPAFRKAVCIVNLRRPTTGTWTGGQMAEWARVELMKEGEDLPPPPLD